MNKKNLVAAVVGVLVVGGASGQFYATHKLKSSYQNNFNIQDKRLNVDVTQFDMGLISGKARWNAEIVPDLCDKNNMSKIIKIRSEDTIKRTLSGYRVHSKIYVTSPQDNQEFFLFDAYTDSTWSGNLHTEWVREAGAELVDGSTVKWDTARLAFDLQHSGKENTISHVKFSAPYFAVQDIKEGLSLEMKDMEATSDWLDFVPVRNNTSVGKIGSVSFSMHKENEPEVNLVLKQIENVGKSVIKDGMLDLINDYHIGSVTFNQYTFDQIKFNAAAKNINMDVVQSVNDFLKTEQAQRCVPYEEMSKIGTENYLKLLQTGIFFESKGNQIRLNNSSVVANAEFAFPKGDFPNKEAAQQAVVEAFIKQQGVKADMSVDRQFIDELNKLISEIDKKPMMGKAELDKQIQEIVTSLGGKMDDKTIVLTFPPQVPQATQE